MSAIKQVLFNRCLQNIEQRIADATDAIQSARQASGDETKSSAGDKYETTRAMMQQEIDRNMRQADEASRQKTVLLRLQHVGANATAIPGSLVTTSNGVFYLSISAGVLIIDGQKYMAISPASPLGSKLLGTSAGNEVVLNGKKYVVISIS